MKNQFFAFISRMKYIRRWGLMRNTEPENLKEHSFSVAVTAHALGVIGNTYFGKNHNPERLAVLGLYHDAEETITGDMPTPVKYFSPVLRAAYSDVEKDAQNSLLNMLPVEMAMVYKDIIGGCTEEEKKLCKAADVIDAYIKCLEELKCGNNEFKKAKESTEKKLSEYTMPEVKYYMEHFAPAFELTLDELQEK